jgi:serine/threonine protein phosphatase PrpC
MSIPFDQLTQKLSNGEIVSFSPDINNVILNFVDLTGQIKQTVAQFDKMTNQIFPPQQFISFPDFSQLLSTGQILSVEQKIQPTSSPNTVLNFVDKSGKIYSSIVKYDSLTNTILPPLFHDSLALMNHENTEATVKILDNIPNGCLKYIIGRADEDRSTIALLNGDIQMYAIYDGHAGKDVADYLKVNLAPKLAYHLLNIDFNDQQLIKQIINKVYIDIDRQMNDLHLNSGSTANAVLRKGNRLYIINIADSRAIIFNLEGRLLLETIDHDGDNLSEKTRVESLGGVIYNGRIAGSLMVTRAFGDFIFKRKSSSNYDPQGWVSVIPDIFTFDITPNSSLLIASDGLWAGQYNDSQTVVNLIKSLPQDVSTLCESIAKEGKRNYPTDAHYKDDITVILIRL